jgi:hypothetical protein
LFPNIHGKLDGKDLVERKRREKLKQSDSQNLGKANLLLANSPLGPLNAFYIFFYNIFFVFLKLI